MTAAKTRTRRQVLKAAGGAALVAGLAPSIVIPGRAAASRPTLKILQWKHFVPAFDEWFNKVYVVEWGRRNDVDVVVDNVGMTSLVGRATAEISAQRGHDLCMFLSPPSSFEEHVVDLRDVYEECESRYGKPIELGVRSSYNPKTGKYYGFSDSYVPDPINYRADLWGEVGHYPNSWDDVRAGARKIKQDFGVPAGFGLAPELDTNMGLRSIMAAFGASVQDAEGRPVLKSPETLEALKFVKALYQESMTDEVFTWDASSNNRQMLAGRGSITLNAISITRTGETQRIPVADRIALARAPEGPVRRIGLQHLLDVYVIWEFAENIEIAKQFLIDYVGESRSAFLSSQFYNFPCFPETVPDIGALIARDPQATPADKYNVFVDVSDWMTNLGFPGYANAAEDELFGTWAISNLFAEVARGRATPEEALDRTDLQVRAVFDKWREKGIV